MLVPRHDGQEEEQEAQAQEELLRQTAEEALQTLSASVWLTDATRLAKKAAAAESTACQKPHTPFSPPF
jgi:hypothetical protein